MNRFRRGPPYPDGAAGIPRRPVTSNGRPPGNRDSSILGSTSASCQSHLPVPEPCCDAHRHATAWAGNSTPAAARAAPAQRRSTCSDPNGPVASGESADRPKGGGAAPKLTVEKAGLAYWVQPRPDIAEDGVSAGGWIPWGRVASAAMTRPMPAGRGSGRPRVSRRAACGFADNASAFPTPQQAPHQQQKRDENRFGTSPRCEPYDQPAHLICRRASAGFGGRHQREHTSIPDNQSVTQTRQANWRPTAPSKHGTFPAPSAPGIDRT